MSKDDLYKALIAQDDEGKRGDELRQDPVQAKKTTGSSGKEEDNSIERDRVASYLKSQRQRVAKKELNPRQNATRATFQMGSYESDESQSGDDESQYSPYEKSIASVQKWQVPGQSFKVSSHQKGQESNKDDLGALADSFVDGRNAASNYTPSSGSQDVRAQERYEKLIDAMDKKAQALRAKLRRPTTREMEVLLRRKSTSAIPSDNQGPDPIQRAASSSPTMGQGSVPLGSGRKGKGFCPHQ